jgi:ComEC/Rec2-related protein
VFFPLKSPYTLFLLLCAAAVSLWTFFTFKPKWGFGKGKVEVEGKVISVNYNRALVVDQNQRLWSVRFKGARVYPDDAVRVVGYAYGGRVYAKEVKVKRHLLQKLRVKIHSFLKWRFLNTADDKFAKKLGSALIFGENWFSKKEREKISRLGIYHLIVISGMHYALFLTFFLALPVRWGLRWKAALLFFSFFTFFLLFPKAPAYRAFVSIALLLLAKLIERPYNALKALLIAYSLSLLFYPHWFYNFGFWLSYLASLSLILYYGFRKTPEQDYFKSFVSKTLGIEASVVVTATISPILVYYLKYLSFGVFVYGFIFTLVAELYILIATANLLTLWSLPPLTWLQNRAADLFEFFYALFPTGLSVDTPQPPVWQMYLFVALSLLILLTPFGRKVKWLALLLLLSAEALVFVVANEFLYGS